MSIPLRRQDRAMNDPADIARVIDACKVCHVAMCDGDTPYLVPMNYGYRFQDGRLTLYFHGAKEGRKLDILRRNPRVCFEMDTAHKLLTAAGACGHGYAFESVLGTGTARTITDPAEKIDALQAIMRHQTGREFPLNEKMADAVNVLAVEANEYAGKRRAR